MCLNELQSLIAQGLVIQVPAEVIDGKTLYEHTDGYFISATGYQPAHCYKPDRASLKGRIAYPKMRQYGNKDCHYLSACTFYHIPDRAKGEVVDHIDGNVLDYSKDNIRVVHKSINWRDGGFIRKLRNKGINPAYYATPFLLRFFDRMAEYKSTHTNWQYQCLDRTALLKLLVEPEYRVGPPLDPAAEPNKYYDPFIERDDPAAHLAPFH